MIMSESELPDKPLLFGWEAVAKVTGLRPEALRAHLKAGDFPQPHCLYKRRKDGKWIYVWEREVVEKWANR